MNRFILTQILVFACGVTACANRQPVEPVTSDADIAGIDPNQKALPKDGPTDRDPVASDSAEPSKPITDVTLDGQGEVLDKMPSSPKSREGAADDSSTKSVTASDSAGTGVGNGSLGSGPQTRYVKAWDLHIRTQPNRFSKIVGRLKGGDEVRVSIHGGWAKLNEGEWIRSRWLLKTRPSHYVGEPGGSKPEPAKKKSTGHSKSKTRRKKQGH